MPLSDIAAFTRWVATDPAGVPERLALLAQHRERVIRRQEQLTVSLRVIDQKIRDYQQRLDDQPDRRPVRPRKRGDSSAPSRIA